MDRLKELLEKVSDTYEDFVTGVLIDVRGKEGLTNRLIDFIERNPNAETDDIDDYLDELEGLIIAKK